MNIIERTKMNSIIKLSEYRDWLHNLKQQIKTGQIKAALSVNSQMIMLYWDMGRQIADNHENIKLEQVVPILEQLEIISEQVIHKFTFVPWGHHMLILKKVKDVREAIFYINKTIENNWSRAVLEYQIESNLYDRQGKAVTNFNLTLPAPQSDLANEMMKDPYNFDSLRLSEKVKETDLEKALVQHISHFLPELGIGFAYMGRQFMLKDVNNPIGVSNFHYTELAEDIKAALPSAEELQNELLNFEREHEKKKNQ